jgi:hypothetical protein
MAQNTRAELTCVTSTVFHVLDQMRDVGISLFYAGFREPAIFAVVEFVPHTQRGTALTKIAEYWPP